GGGGRAAALLVRRPRVPIVAGGARGRTPGRSPGRKGGPLPARAPGRCPGRSPRRSVGGPPFARGLPGGGRHSTPRAVRRLPRVRAPCHAALFLVEAASDRSGRHLAARCRGPGRRTQIGRTS